MRTESFSCSRLRFNWTLVLVAWIDEEAKSCSSKGRRASIQLLDLAAQNFLSLCRCNYELNQMFEPSVVVVLVVVVAVLSECTSTVHERQFVCRSSSYISFFFRQSLWPNCSLAASESVQWNLLFPARPAYTWHETWRLAWNICIHNSNAPSAKFRMANDWERNHHHHHPLLLHHTTQTLSGWTHDSSALNGAEQWSHKQQHHYCQTNSSSPANCRASLANDRTENSLLRTPQTGTSLERRTNY